uniref:CS domain-containing protein n=1 Tax=Zooxanthella nutricula TaxID=1333877 RepID=A0A6U6M792_9DINO|mmetsp:Transcript_36149/g.109293  ORF Transcript_36149/g.109293 Transcript_36149/m.109293 type:complete len:111 (+) Transcript_36149:3-335(+)
MMGGKGGGKGEKDDSEKAVDGGKYHWQQKGEEVQIRFPADPPLVKKDVAVKFKRASLQVMVRGEAVIDGTLAGTVEVDECTWCLAPKGSELQIMLTKQRDEEWPALLDAK